jgi:hypothetical protein
VRYCSAPTIDRYLVASSIERAPPCAESLPEVASGVGALKKIGGVLGLSQTDAINSLFNFNAEEIA